MSRVMQHSELSSHGRGVLSGIALNAAEIIEGLMVGADDINSKVNAVQDLLRDKFGLRKRALPRMVQRAGRRLPKRVQAQALTLVKAQELVQNPKLAKQVNQVEIARAYQDITAHLGKIDVAERRKDAILGMAGTIAFNILLVAVAFVIWLWWRGFI